MKKKNDRITVDKATPFDDALKALHKFAKESNAGVSVFVSRNCGSFEGADLFVVMAEKGANKFDVVETIVKSLVEEDDA